MPEAFLQGRRGLIVEDDYFLAENMRADFEREGAEVIGSIGRVSDALSLVPSSEPLYGAVLDIIVSILSCLVMNSLK
jgi:ActR/RegA family two-component response regulator